MPRYDNAHEMRIALSVQKEETGMNFLERGTIDIELSSVICEDCLHEWEEEEPESCPICGGEEVAEN